MREFRPYSSVRGGRSGMSVPTAIDIWIGLLGSDAVDFMALKFGLFADFSGWNRR